MIYFSEEITDKIIEQSIDIDVIPIEERLPEYSHITVSVKSLSEYMKVIAFLYECDNSPDDNLVFRGVSDYKYSLSPSLKVFKEQDDYAYVYDDNIENVLVREMLTTRPEEFEGVTSDFDLLAKMQHLGLPTRLLDFSLNPLVALYFACQSLTNTTARVLCTPDTSSVYSREIVEKICGLYRIPEFAQTYLEDLLHDDAGIIRYMGVNLEPIMARPKYISERIRRQSGIFMIFPNEVTDRVWYDIAHWGGSTYTCPRFICKGLERHQAIKEKEDPYVIYEIDRKHELKVDHFVVTPDTFYRMKEYYRDEGGFFVHKDNILHINDRIAWMFKKRFSINKNVANLSGKIMEENFCSILIEAKYKKTILQELDRININEAFLFPEPEYTAKRIKNRYLRKKQL